MGSVMKNGNMADELCTLIAGMKIILILLTLTTVSHSKLCKDESCKDVIAEAKVQTDYAAEHEEDIDLLQNTIVHITAKSDGQKGWFPADKVQITQVHTPDGLLIPVLDKGEKFDDGLNDEEEHKENEPSNETPEAGTKELEYPHNKFTLERLHDADLKVNRVLQGEKFSELRRQQIRDYIKSHFPDEEIDDEMRKMIDELISVDLMSELKNFDNGLYETMTAEDRVFGSKPPTGDNQSESKSETQDGHPGPESNQDMPPTTAPPATTEIPPTQTDGTASSTEETISPSAFPPTEVPTINAPEETNVIPDQASEIKVESQNKPADKQKDKQTEENTPAEQQGETQDNKPTNGDQIDNQQNQHIRENNPEAEPENPGSWWQSATDAVRNFVKSKQPEDKSKETKAEPNVQEEKKDEKQSNQEEDEHEKTKKEEEERKQKEEEFYRKKEEEDKRMREELERKLKEEEELKAKQEQERKEEEERQKKAQEALQKQREENERRMREEEEFIKKEEEEKKKKEEEEFIKKEEEERKKNEKQRKRKLGKERKKNEN